MKRRVMAAQGKEEQWRCGEEGSRGGDPVTFRRCCRHGGWCRCARSRSRWWRSVDVKKGAASSGSVKDDDATRAWEVVILSRPSKNAPLMKTGGE